MKAIKPRPTVAYCDGVQAIDGWTGKPLGVMSGVHILNDEPAPGERCPKCGCELRPKRESPAPGD